MSKKMSNDMLFEINEYLSNIREATGDDTYTVCLWDEGIDTGLGQLFRGLEPHVRAVSPRLDGPGLLAYLAAFDDGVQAASRAAQRGR